MCDFISWINLRPAARAKFGIDKTIIFLEDDMAKVLLNTNKVTDISELCGHHALLKYYNIPCKHGTSDLRHEESFIKIPRVIAKAVNNGHLDYIYKCSDIYDKFNALFPNYLPRYDKNGTLILPEGFKEQAEKALKEYSSWMYTHIVTYFKKNHRSVHLYYSMNFTHSHLRETLGGEFDYALLGKIRNSMLKYKRSAQIENQFNQFNQIMSINSVRDFTRIESIDKEIRT